MKKIIITIGISLMLATVASAQLKVFSTGATGIGTAPASPTLFPFTNSQLDVEGNVYIPYGKSYYIGATADAGSRLRMHHSGSASDAYIDFYPQLHIRANTTDAMIITSDGNFGIGGIAPVAKFDINGANNQALMLHVNQSYDWGHSMTTYVGRPTTVSYVVNDGSGDKFYVYANGQILTAGVNISSDSILKKNINPITPTSLPKLLRLKGMNYDFKSDSGRNIPLAGKSLQSSKNNGRHFGFIAQDVEKIFPELVSTLQDGTKAVNYIELIPFIIEAMKEQSKTIDSIKTQNVLLSNQLADLQNCCTSKGGGKLKSGNETETITNASITTTQTDGAKLYQNAPNPFKESTTIKLEIPQSVNAAMVCIYDLNGRQLKCLTVSGRGTTSVQIFGNELTAGLYHYALIADGALVDTKTMVLTN